MIKDLNKQTKKQKNSSLHFTRFVSDDVCSLFTGQIFSVETREKN